MNNNHELIQQTKERIRFHVETYKKGLIRCRYCLNDYPITERDPEITEGRRPLCDDCVEVIKRTR